MAYDPYKDITDLTKKAKSEGITADDVYDIIKKGDTFYKSTYGNLNREIKSTKDYISGGGAYNDAGASAIRKAYADYADREQGHTAAKLAGENGGNLNSYAAAQANRSAADMLALGEDAVKERADAVYEGMLEADKLFAESAQTVNDGVQSGVSAAVNATVDLAKASSDERKSALGALLDLYGILRKA